MIAEDQKVMEGLSSLFLKGIHPQSMADKLDRVLWEYILYKLADNEISSNKSDADDIYWIHELCAVLKGQPI